MQNLFAQRPDLIEADLGQRHGIIDARQLTLQRLVFLDDAITGELGQRLAPLIESREAALEAGEAGKVIVALQRQMMSLVKDVNGVLRCRQNDTPAESQIGQHQIVVGDDTIGLLHLFACLVEAAVTVVRALLANALPIVHSDWNPVLVTEQIFPIIAVALPLACIDFAQHALIERQSVIVRLADDFAIEVGHGIETGIALQQHVQPGETQVAAAPLGQGEAEFEIAVTLDIRQVLQSDLLLQRNRGRRQYHLFLQRFRHRQSTQHIGQRLAGAGAGLDDTDRPGRQLGIGFSFHRHWRLQGRPLRIRNAAQTACNLRDHEALPITRRQRFVLQDLPVGALDGVLDVIGKHRLGELTVVLQWEKARRIGHGSVVSIALGMRCRGANATICDKRIACYRRGKNFC